MVQKKWILVALLMIGAASVVKASSVIVDFPAAGDTYMSQTEGSGTLSAGGETSYMWTTGDYIEGTVNGGGVIDVDQASFTFTVQNFLFPSETVGAYIDGVEVGTVNIPGCDACGDYDSYMITGSFAPVSGSTYNLELELLNTVGGGDGSIAFTDGGMATLTSSAATPEPSSFLLLATGLAGLAGALRRKFAR